MEAITKRVEITLVPYCLKHCCNLLAISNLHEFAVVKVVSTPNCSQVQCYAGRSPEIATTKMMFVGYRQRLDIYIA